MHFELLTLSKFKIIYFRCVVSSLTEEGPNDLADELVRGEIVQIDENTPVDDDSDNWETWVPDPMDNAPSNILNIFIYRLIVQKCSR